jgi:Vps16, N-terminal region
MQLPSSRSSLNGQFVHIFDNDAAQMTASNPRAGWEKVGDQFYRKIQLYESVFDPDLELENYLVAGAPYGGAIGRWQ